MQTRGTSASATPSGSARAGFAVSSIDGTTARTGVAPDADTLVPSALSQGPSLPSSLPAAPGRSGGPHRSHGQPVSGLKS